MSPERDTTHDEDDRPEIKDPPGGPRGFRASWPARQRVEWWLVNHDRHTMMRWLLTNPRVRELVDDPQRDLGNSPRLRNQELAAIITALSTPRNPLG